MNVLAAMASTRIKNIALFAVLATFFISCSVVKDYPSQKPFVYETPVELMGNLTTDERKQLTSRLQEQMHDSIQVRRVRKLIGWEKGPRLLYSELKRPPLYDSLNADKSVIFMRALLNSLGYYRDTITYDTSLQISDDQFRTYVNFRVTPGKLIRIDSISYNMQHDSLQKITEASLGESLLKKGQPFAKPLISAEFDRLTDTYRNNGFLRFSFDKLLAVWDTVGLALLRPTIDPIEQAQQLEALRARRENPTADIEVRLRTTADSAHLIRYHVGTVTIYPDLSPDTALYIPVTRMAGSTKIVSYHSLFKTRILLENIFLHRGDLYRQRNYLRTLNRFNSLGAWRLVNIDQVPRTDSDTVDFTVKLTPAAKYIFEGNIESSQNWGAILTQGNLIGLSVSLQNRNFARAANQANTSFRLGTELNPKEFAQTRQLSFSHSITFPRAIPRFKFISTQLRESFQTSLAFNANYINRLDFLELLTINGSWGYKFNWKNKQLSLRLPNIEYTFLQRGPDLIALIQGNASFRYIFNDGFVSSVIAGLVINKSKKAVTNSARFNVEASGIATSLINSKFLDSNLYRFIKLDADFRQTYTIRRTAFAWRIFGGVGRAMPMFSTDSSNLYLPFFKAYFAGGANSMRAWALRKLGPGSTVKSFARTEAPDRFGDLQLELNAEYRFFVGEVAGVKLNSVLFTDMGNIWYLRRNNDFPEGQFKFQNLWRDLAIGAGTGLRIDFGLFLVRLDWAYKLKDPSPAELSKQNKFFPERSIGSGQLQLGVTYPF
jgi:outer membrane protein assembly factor BamA